MRIAVITVCPPSRRSSAESRALELTGLVGAFEMIDDLRQLRA